MERRKFIKNAAIGSVFLPLLILNPAYCQADKQTPMLKDNFWLWGHTAGAHNGSYNLQGVNRMEPKEGCDFLGIEKCLRVTYGDAGPLPPFDEEAEKIKDLKEVVWSSIGAGGQLHNGQSMIDEVLRMATIYPNVTGAVLDDFFGVKHSPESIRSMADKLHHFAKRRLDLWVVWYTFQLDINISQYIGSMDVFTIWTWKGSELPEYDSNIRKFIEKTPGKRRLIGVYMWDFGEAKPLTIDQMKFQLDRCYYWLKEGSVEGLVFCSNTILDLGLDTVEYTRKWISETGSERIKAI